MIVNVAGAGAGKTTKMADVIMAHDIPDGKVVFCIAFTNAAADNIKRFFIFTVVMVRVGGFHRGNVVNIHHALTGLASRNEWPLMVLILRIGAFVLCL